MIVAVILELVCKREGSHAEPIVLTEESDTIDDVVIVTPEEKSITVRVMTVSNRSRTITNGKVNAEDDEPITLGTLIPDSSRKKSEPTRCVTECQNASADSIGEGTRFLGTARRNNAIDELVFIGLSIELLDNQSQPTHLDFRTTDKGIALKKDDSYYIYL